MIIEKKNVAQLLPAEYNPRKDLKPGYPEYEKLKRSIEQFGDVIVNRYIEQTGSCDGVYVIRDGGKYGYDEIVITKNDETDLSVSS